MSEHSLEELKRQMEAASSKAKEAAARANEAKRRYDVARFESYGFKGCVAEVTKRGKTVRFLPVRRTRWDFMDEIEGPLIKKDGTPGERLFRAEVKDCVNLGPFAALSKEGGEE